MQPLEFLERVLPNEGNYCLTLISGTIVQNVFFNSKADIVYAAKAYDGKKNIYYALASYGTISSKGRIQRTKENVQFLRVLWADIDIRTDKGDKCYQTFEEATTAIGQFLAKTNLPCPSFVYSGGGIHLYWPLSEDVTEKQWLPYAEGLKKLAAKEGFKIDQGITGDSARVLRLPGTQNLRWGTTCQVLKYTGEFSLSALDVLKLPSKLPSNASASRLASVAKVAAEPKKTKFELVDSAPIFAGCAQMKLFQIGWPDQTGEHWISCGRLLKQCTDGEKIWHELSEKDDRYNESETAKKWNDSTTFNNAITCERFGALNPEGCAGCKYRGKIKTPIGIVRGKPASEEYTQEVSAKLDGDKLPYGYSFDGTGAVVFSSQEKDEEEAKEIKLSTYPFYIKDRSLSELKDGERSIVIESWNPKDGWSQNDIAVGDMFLNPVVALAKVGIMINNEKMIRNFIRASFDKLANEKKMATVHDTFGWKGDKFLLGDRLYYFEGDKLAFETAHLGPDARSLASHLRPGGSTGKGSFQGWQRAAQGLFARGHEWQALSVLAGAAAPLLGRMDDIEGGTILSLFNSIGGEGKTTATIAGVTIWGGWPALSTAASDTINARIAKLGTLKHLPFAYDEMRRDNPGIAKQFVQTFTAGSERARMDKSGSLSKSPRNWRTIMLTSANTELMGTIAADDGSEAMSDRVFELHAETLPLSKGERNNNIKSEFLNNCGWAALPIVALMLRDLDRITREIKEKEAYYMELLDDSKLRFRAQFVAAIDVMGRLLADNNILVFDPQYYVDWALDHIKEGLEVTKKISFPELLARYLREMQNSTIFTHEFRPGTGKKVIAETRSGLANVRIETDTNRIIIPQRDFYNWLQERDQSSKTFNKWMEDAGVLIGKNQKKNIGAGTQYATAQEYVLIFKSDHVELTGIDNVIQLTQPQEVPASAPRLAALSRR